MNIKVSELFTSLQGESLWTGTPSLFIRTFGCNFKCQGFGMPRGQLSNEYLNVDPSKYPNYDQLPLVHTGCDSYPSWDPRFKKLSKTYTIEQLVDRIQQMLPNQRFGPVHLIFTGGEPLLGWQKQYIALLDLIAERDMDLFDITFETNGTKNLEPAFAQYLNSRPSIRKTFSISSKLPSSGEKWEDAIRPDVVKQYTSIDNSICYFKWVCSDPQDLEDVFRAKAEYAEAGINIPIYLMPAGGTDKLYNTNKQWLSQVCLENGFRYSARLHIDLYGNSWGA